MFIGIFLCCNHSNACYHFIRRYTGLFRVIRFFQITIMRIYGSIVPWKGMLLFVHVPIFIRSIRGHDSTCVTTLFFRLPSNLVFHLFPRNVSFTTLPTTMAILPRVTIYNMSIVTPSFFREGRNTYAFYHFRSGRLSFITRGEYTRMFVRPNRRLFSNRSIRLRAFLRGMGLHYQLIPRQRGSSRSKLFFRCTGNA